MIASHELASELKKKKSPMDCHPDVGALEVSEGGTCVGTDAGMIGLENFDLRREVDNLVDPRIGQFEAV